MSIPLSLNWSVVGLAYDIAGAIALASALFFNTPVKIAHQAGTYWNSNPHALKAFAEQTVDARLGLCLLVAGFGFQAFGQWWSQYNLVWQIVVLAALVPIVVAFLLARGALVRRVVDRAKRTDDG